MKIKVIQTNDGHVDGFTLYGWDEQGRMMLLNSIHPFERYETYTYSSAAEAEREAERLLQGPQI